MTNPDSVDASTSCQECISAIVPPIFCNSLALSDAAVWWTNSSMMQQCFGKYEPREGKQLSRYLDIFHFMKLAAMTHLLLFCTFILT